MAAVGGLMMLWHWEFHVDLHRCGMLDDGGGGSSGSTLHGVCWTHALWWACQAETWLVEMTEAEA